MFASFSFIYEQSRFVKQGFLTISLLAEPLENVNKHNLTKHIYNFVMKLSKQCVAPLRSAESMLKITVVYYIKSILLNNLKFEIF